MSPEPDAALHDQLQEDAEATYRDDHVSASVHVPITQNVMRISDKTNYRHFYELPADVGIQNVPRLMDAMLREGCDLRNVVIDFEARPVRGQ